MNRRNLAFVAFFFQARPVRSGLAVGLLALAGLAEGVGVMALLPVLQIAVAPGLDGGAAGAFVTHLLAALGWTATLPVLLATIFLAMSLKAALNFAAMLQVGSMTAAIGVSLRLSLIGAWLAARPGFLAERSLGEGRERGQH